jgi:curved DNA-binding protein CbpA
MEKTIDYYEILSVSRNADLSIIKSAYRTLANKYHPDKCEDNLKENAEEKIRLINEAYEVLSDPIKKSEYDQKIKNSKFARPRTYKPCFYHVQAKLCESTNDYETTFGYLLLNKIDYC